MQIAKNVIRDGKPRLKQFAGFISINYPNRPFSPFLPFLVIIFEDFVVLAPDAPSLIVVNYRKDPKKPKVSNCVIPSIAKEMRLNSVGNVVASRVSPSKIVFTEILQKEK